MAFVPVPNTIEVDVRATLLGQRIENTLYLRMDHAPTAGDVADAAAAIRGWWVAEVLPNISQDYVMGVVHAKDLTVASGAEVDNTVSVGVVGGDASASMPGNVALAVSFRTGLAGRSNRGRNYIPGVPRVWVAGNMVSGTWAGLLTAAYDELITTLAASDFVWVVVSRFTSGAVRAAGVTNPILNSLVTDLAVDSMRRRLQGRGQ